MVVTTKEEALRLTVPKLKEELTARGLSHDGLKAALSQRLIADIEARTSEMPEEEYAEDAAEETNSEPDPEAEAAETEPEPEAEIAEPEAMEAEAVKLEVVKAEAVEPEAVEPEAVEPEEVEPEEVEPEEVELEWANCEPMEAEPMNAENVAESEAMEPKAELVTAKVETVENQEKETEPAAADATEEADPSDFAEAKPTSVVAKEEVVENDGAKSPVSTGGDDEPPSKKAKTETGAANGTPKKPRITGDPNGREVFIDNLPEACTREEVLKIAEEKGGPVASVRLIMSRDEEPVCRGMALVRYMIREDATKALENIPNEKMGENVLQARVSSNANTLFIGNLNKSWTKEVVLKEFEQLVEGIVNFEVTMDALNKDLNRGFGFATFETVESCKAAHAKYNKDKLKVLDTSVLMDWAETRGGKEDDDRGVYITNVDENVEDDVFRETFSKFGEIDKIIYGRLIGHARRKDFAIINYNSRDAANKCIKEMNGKTFMARQLEVTMAKAKRKRSDTFNTFGGRGGGRGFNSFNHNNSRGGFNSSPGRGGPPGRGGGAPYGMGYASGGRGGGRGGRGGSYPRPYGGGGGPYMPGGGGGPRGHPPLSPYNGGGGRYVSGGYGAPPNSPSPYMQPQTYPPAGGYGAQPAAPRPYHSGGSGGSQSWRQQR